MLQVLGQIMSDAFAAYEHTKGQLDGVPSANDAVYAAAAETADSETTNTMVLPFASALLAKNEVPFSPCHANSAKDAMRFSMREMTLPMRYRTPIRTRTEASWLRYEIKVAKEREKARAMYRYRQYEPCGSSPGSSPPAPSRKREHEETEADWTLLQPRASSLPPAEPARPTRPRRASPGRPATTNPSIRCDEVMKTRALDLEMAGMTRPTKRPRLVKRVSFVDDWPSSTPLERIFVYEPDDTMVIPPPPSSSSSSSSSPPPPVYSKESMARVKKLADVVSAGKRREIKTKAKTKASNHMFFTSFEDARAELAAMAVKKREEEEREVEGMTACDDDADHRLFDVAKPGTVTSLMTTRMRFVLGESSSVVASYGARLGPRS
ncbi:hypothetical protein FRB96_008039 [Tulasnella sp. 330]|nr:hypothetical protein FRB96_008039 [Tulasnella sp. 330]